MIKNLTYIQLLILLFQLILFEFTIVIALSCLIISVFLIIQLKAFKKNEITVPVVSGSYLNISLILFGLLSIWSLYYMQINERNIIVTSLSSLKNTHNIGIFYKNSSVFLPVLAVIINLSTKNNIFKYIITVLLFIVSAKSSIFVLSKLPLLNFFLYFLLVHKPNKKMMIIMGIGAVFLLNIIYVGRGQVATINDTVFLLIKRIPLLDECSVIIQYLFDNLIYTNTVNLTYADFVTEKIFNRDSSTIGIAPSLVGSFLLIFSVFSPIVFFLFVSRLAIFLKYLSSLNLLGSIVALTISFELPHTFIDGLPHIYNSTRNGSFFWGLLFLILTSLMFRKKINKFSFAR